MSERYEDDSYRQANPTWHTEASGWKAAQVLKMLTRHNLQFRSCAEIGCGAGHVIRTVASAYPDANFTGFDIAPAAASFWSEDHQVAFRLEDITQTDAHFDLVLMLDVFEHVEDYLGFLRACRKHGGRFLFHVPLDMHVSGLLRDQQIHARNKNGHLHYFSRATAIATLTDSGYRVVDEFYTAGTFTRYHAKTWKTRVLNVARAMAFAVNRNLAVKTFGGYSLMVLAEPVVD